MVKDMNRSAMGKLTFGTAVEEKIFLVITIILLCMALYLTVAGVVIISHCCGFFRRPARTELEKEAEEREAEESNTWVLPFRSNSRQRAFSSITRIVVDELDDPHNI